MKYTVVFLVCFIFSLSVKGQSNLNIGLKGGMNFTFFRVNESNFGLSQETRTGFYGGMFFDFEIDDTFSVQPEVLFIILNDFKFLNLPIYAKYEMANNLDVLVGPSVNYFFDFFSNKLKIRADLCTAYNISKTLDVHIKYTIGFQEITPNGLFIGIGYRL